MFLGDYYLKKLIFFAVFSSFVLSIAAASELDAKSKIEIKSTVGAGDAFTAAAVMGWLEQKPLEQIIQKASDLATFVCSHLEAVPTKQKTEIR